VYRVKQKLLEGISGKKKYHTSKMKGKVNCTCGWSWNKSDSSAKDMYICHECGRDNSNNMKNGGWLDNYNDSQASAPEGMIGDGYSNVGRDYSPAWGGQFQEGGEIPMAQDGKATRADSLAVYNNAKKVEDYYKSKNYKLEKQDAFVSNNDPSRLKKILSDDESRFTKKQYNETSTGYDNILYFPSKRKIIKNNKESFIDSANPKNKEILKKIYNKKIDDNKLIQREGANRILNLDSPSQYFDLRIQPQSMSSYKDVSKNTLTSNDKVDIIKYDPLAVKPFDLLTDAEKKLRVEKYGTDGVPKSYLNKNKPTTTKQTTKPSNTGWTPLTKKIAKGRYEGDLKNMVYKKRADGSYDITYQAPPEVSRKTVQPLIPLQPIGIQNDFNIESTPLPVIRPDAKIPKSYDISTVFNSMKGPTTGMRFDNKAFNRKEASLEQAMQILEYADKYNANIQEKYGPEGSYYTRNSPRLEAVAADRANKIKLEVGVKPNYQMGGNVYPVNYVPQAQEGKTMFKTPSIVENDIDYNDYTYSYPEREPYSSELEFLKTRPDVGGMATEDNHVIINPYSPLPEKNKNYVRELEQARLAMRNGYERPTFKLTPKQEEYFSTMNNGKPYSEDLQDIRETIASRILVGDETAQDITKEQQEYADKLAEALYKSKEYATGMKGMMKSKIGMGNAFEHPAIKRMSQAMPKTGMTPEGTGTHYMNSVDNYAVPELQDLGEEELTLVDPDSRSREAIRFNSPEEANYFAKNYKDVAPMTNIFGDLNSFKAGGSIPQAQKGKRVNVSNYNTKLRKKEKVLIKKYVTPAQQRAQEIAVAQGINTGLHNGPLDAIRHSSSSAATSSILPSWANFIPGVAPLNILAANIAGAAHELNAPNNSLKEHVSDLYNNFIGSVVGALPMSEKKKHELLIQAQKNNVLSNLGDKTPLNKKPTAPQLPQLKLPSLPKRETGGSIPGATGSMYARVGAPSNGPYAKKTMASAQNGVDMYDNPMLARRVDNTNIDRSYYDPRLNTMNIGSDYNMWHDEETGELLTGDDLKYHQDKMLAHENYHAMQHSEDRDNYDIAHDTDNAQWAQMQKRPELMSTNAVWNNFYNRSDIENQQDYQDMINYFPESRILNEDLLFDKVLDGARYNNPSNAEGEAKFYEDTGVKFQNGGEMRYYQNGLDWKPKGMKNGGWLDGYEKAQGGLTMGTTSIENDVRESSAQAAKANTEAKKQAKLNEAKLLAEQKENKRNLFPRDIKVKQPDGTIKIVNTGSPEYEEMYKAGNIQSPGAGEGDTPFYGGQLDDLVVQQKMTPLLKGKKDYGYMSNKEAFINRKKDEYIKSLGSRGNWFGATRSNFPETVLSRINREYDYNQNTRAIEDVAKAKGFDLNTRGEWIYNLTPGEKEALINSKYSAQLNPNEFSEMLSGVQQLANTSVPGKPWNFKIPGLTERELEEDREAMLSPLKTFAPFNLPGNFIANSLRNIRNSDVVETPWFGMQRMGDVSALEAMALNPLNLTMVGGAANLLTKGLPALAKGLPALAKGLPSAARAIGSGFKNAGRVLGTEEGLIGKVSNELNINTSLSKIKKEGQLQGLSDYEIAKKQMEQVGITSNQRKAYIPLVSEFAEKYIKPVSYESANNTKLQDILINIKNGGYPVNEVVYPRMDAWKLYLGKPQVNNTFSLADTAPAIHPSYKPGSLEGMDIYNINNKRITSWFPPESPDFVTYNNQHLKFLENPISVSRDNNIMGGYNRILTKEGTQYNDIWDLDPPISFRSLFPNKISENPLLENVFYKTNSKGVSTPKGIKIPVSKFFGKPFMSHGNLPYTSVDHVNTIKFDINKQLNHLKSTLTPEELLNYKNFPRYEEALKELENYPKHKQGGIIKDDRGQWDHPGEITRISGGNITMKRDPKTGKALTQPILGIADTGEEQWMYPGEDYNFEGANYVTEYPKGKKPRMAKNGLRQEQKGLQNLDNLLNFTNYNKPQPGGWLSKYE
jgi:hypothetical protein